MADTPTRKFVRLMTEDDWRTYKKEKETTWSNFRQLGPADVYAMYQYVADHYSYHVRRAVTHEEEQTGKKGRAREIAAEWYGRMAALSNLMNYLATKGPRVPEWKDVPTEQKEYALHDSQPDGYWRFDDYTRRIWSLYVTREEDHASQLAWGESALRAIEKRDGFHDDVSPGALIKHVKGKMKHLAPNGNWSVASLKMAIESEAERLGLSSESSES